MKDVDRSKRLRQLFVAGALLAFAVMAVMWWRTTHHDARLRVGLFLYAQHPVLFQMRDGFRTRFSELAASRGLQPEYIERNADGSATNAALAANYFRSSEVDSVMVVGLVAAQALKSADYNRPVFFAGLPDPVRTGLIPRLDNPSSTFTGTVYAPPTDLILDTFSHLHPDLRQIAVLHNPSEPSSMAVTTSFITTARSRGLGIRDLSVSGTTEIEAALRGLSTSGSYGLFLPTDNLVYSQLDLVMARAREANLAVFNCTDLAVRKGAEFSIATDYTIVGRLTADLAARVLLDGVRVQEVAPAVVRQGTIYIHDEALRSRISPPPGYNVAVVH